MTSDEAEILAVAALRRAQAAYDAATSDVRAAEVEAHQGGVDPGAFLPYAGAARRLRTAETTLQEAGRALRVLREKRGAAPWRPR